MAFQPVIKWSGSKRSQAKEIVSYFPSYKRYFEPFVGGGSILYQAYPRHGFCSDICKPLIQLWKKVRDDPFEIIYSYKKNWNNLKQNKEYYYQVRDRFNKYQDPNDFLFLSRTCFNGLIRFNSKGEFNSPLHLKRDGILPKKLENIIINWSNRIQKAKFICCDYLEVLNHVKPKDLVYLDPPYFNTKSMYYGKIDFKRFQKFLDKLNSKGVYFLLSLDGKRSEKDLTYKLPKDLYKRHLYIKSGLSSFKRLQNKKDEVYESLYLNF